MDPPGIAGDVGRDEDEWELCNDEGFIYKRRKRRRLSEDPSSSTVDGESAIVDEKAEKRSRRVWKKTFLENLKRKYEVEIERWEALTSGMREMREKASKFQERRWEHTREEDLAGLSGESNRSGATARAEDGAGMLIGELLLLAETQEAIIHDVSNLCDVAEAMCEARDEHLKQSYFDLPIWGLPQELMASLCCDE